MALFISSVHPRGNQYTITNDNGDQVSEKVYNGRAAAVKAMAKMNAPPAKKAAVKKPRVKKAKDEKK